MGNTYTSYNHPVRTYGTVSTSELQRIVIDHIKNKSVNKLHVTQLNNVMNGNTRYCSTIFIDIIEYVFFTYSVTGLPVPSEYFRLITLLLLYGANVNKRKIYLWCKSERCNFLENEKISFVDDSDLLRNITTQHLLLLAQILISNGRSRYILE